MSNKLSHNLDSYQLPGVFAFKVDSPDENLKLIANRLIDYYFYMKSECERKNIPGISGMWVSFTQMFAEFDTALNARDIDKVCATLVNVCTTPLVFGFDSFHSYPALAQDPRSRMFESYLTIDRLLSLAEAIGAAQPHSPYQGRWGYHDMNLGVLLDRIIARLPFSIASPKAGGGTFGIQTSVGIISIADILAMYLANRAHSILADFPQKTVCEIGGGSGTLAFYLAKTCAEKIMIADLPIVSIVQGYYLMRSLGPESVHLAGEPAGSQKVSLIPYWEMDNLPEKSVSLFINSDSMPEIDRNIAEHYMGLIKKKGINAFLSINHETQENGQNLVQNLVEKAGGFKRIYRYQHWILPGHVEELYKIGA